MGLELGGSDGVALDWLSTVGEVEEEKIGEVAKVEEAGGKVRRKGQGRFVRSEKCIVRGFLILHIFTEFGKKVTFCDFLHE